MQLLAVSLTIALFFSDFTASQAFNVSWPNCEDSWTWADNSFGQNPCEVAAYMLATCNGGYYPIPALKPGDYGPRYSYLGPQHVDASNLCLCSTVGYSLLSACAGCQGHSWFTWSDFTTNCTTTLPPSSFPNPIPGGVRVSHWVLLDVTKGNDWDLSKSYAAGASPELGPGTIPGFPVPSVSGSSTSNNAASSTAQGTAVSNKATPTPVGGRSSSAGAIAGGIVGGIAAISILTAALFFYRQRSRATSAASAGGVFGPDMDQTQWPVSGQETATTLPETRNSLMKPYDTDDPTTFPGYQGAPSLPYAPAQVPSNKTLYTVAKPPAQEYHGLPIV